jgi:hypothetical protein
VFDEPTADGREIRLRIREPARFIGAAARFAAAAPSNATRSAATTPMTATIVMARRLRVRPDALRVHQ